MRRSPQIHKGFLVLCLIFALVLGSCKPATEVPIPPTEPPPPAATPVSHITTQRPYAIQNLNDSQLLSSTAGGIIWENSYLTLPESALGVVTSLPLNVAASNFVLYTEFSWDSQDTQGTACGVTFRDSGLGDYYMALARKNGDGLLWLSLADQWQVSPYEGYGNYLNSGNNEVNQLILIAENETITLIVNDTIFYQALDWSLGSGNISLVTGTGDSGNTCTFQNSWIWEIDGSSSDPQVSNPSEVQHEMYTNITNDSEVPFMVIHKTGEMLGLTQDAGTSGTAGAVWISSDGQPLVIFSNPEGMPTAAVVENETLLYSNYTSSTVDVVYIHQDGRREVFRATLDTGLLDKISAISPPSYGMGGANALFMPSSLNLTAPIDYLHKALWLAGFVSCISAAVPSIFTLACGGAILGAVNMALDANHIDAVPLKAFEFSTNLVSCGNRDLKDCFEVGLKTIEAVDAVAQVFLPQAINNTQPTPTKKPKYP